MDLLSVDSIEVVMVMTIHMTQKQFFGRHAPKSPIVKSILIVKPFIVINLKSRFKSLSFGSSIKPFYLGVSNQHYYDLLLYY